MNSRLVLLLFLAGTSFGFPQYEQLPDFRPIPSYELDHFNVHPQIRRSIDTQPLPSLNDLQQTVKEVEEMIKANPELPRLTRGEILDLLENITKSDFQKAQSQQSSNGRGRDPKAIMVVQAITPDNDVNNMEDLFTKSPVTHIVATESYKKEEHVSENKPTLDEHFNYGDNEVFTSTTVKTKKMRGNQRRRTTSTTTTTTSTTTESSSTTHPENTYATHYGRRRPQNKPDSQHKPTKPDPPITTYAPKYRRPILRRPSVSTTEKHPNHRYPDHKPEETTASITYSNQGIQVIKPPKLATPSDVKVDLIDFTKENHAPPYLNKLIANAPTKAPELNTALPIAGIEIPEHLKGLLSEMVLGNPKIENPEEESMIPAGASKIHSVLASQLTPTTSTSMPDISNVADNLTPEMRELLMSFGLIPNPQEQITTQTSDEFNPVKAEVKPESYIGFKPLPDDGPSRAEMDEFLARFGLGRNGRNIKSQKNQNGELALDMVPDDYKGVLEDVGIISRAGKKIRSEALVLEKQQHVFSPDDSKNASEQELEKLNKLLDIIKQLEQLNGTATDDDLKKIDTDSLKELVSSLNVENQEGQITPLGEQSAPDPLNFDLGVTKNEIKRQRIFNTTEIKPNESGSTSEDSKETTPKPDVSTESDVKPQKALEDVKPTEVPSSTMTTEQVITPNIKDLEDSFGGQTDPSTEAPAPETTTSLRKTGFYMLIDWNTFLDIDDQKGKRVNLRFQPTIGDPKRFYSISVP